MKKKQIKSLIQKNQQPLLFSSHKEQAQWFEKIKEKPAYQEMITEIKEEAARLLQEPLQEISFSLFTLFRDRGLRLEYEKSYFELRRRLNTFALMTLLESKQSLYLDHLQEIIWSICNEYSWCLPAHLHNSPELNLPSLQTHEQSTYTIDLFAAETAFTLSEIQQLTKNELDPLLQKRIREEVNRRVLHPFLRQRPFTWETDTHNWAAVCAGSIGSAALYLLEDEEELALLLEKVLRSLDCYLTGFSDDGACLEGYAYWQYGFGYFMYFADLLKRRTAGEIDLFQREKVKEMARFPQKCFVHKNQVLNFSDSPPAGTIFLGLMHYLNELDPGVEVPKLQLRSPYTEDHCSRWAPAFRNLFWFDETKLGKRWENKSYYLKDVQWLITRDAPYVFSCKAGHNDEPHNHNDLGHFMLYANGEVFLKDLGSGMYGEDYFGEKRYSFLGNGSQGHSVPIINQKNQSAGRAYQAKVIEVTIGNQADRIQMELQNAYDIDSLQTLTRTFYWKKGTEQGLTLTDRYHFSKQPMSLIERFIIPPYHVTKTEEGMIVEGKQKLLIGYDQQVLEASVSEQLFLNHFGEEEKVQLLDFTVREPQCLMEVEFRFTFRPG